MIETEWKEPIKARGRGKILVSDDLINMLQSKPGEWLSVGRHTRTAWVRSLKNHFPNQIELTTRDNEGNKAEIYLRWVA